jgi:hypothetical protein
MNSTCYILDTRIHTPGHEWQPKKCFCFLPCAVLKHCTTDCHCLCARQWGPQHGDCSAWIAQLGEGSQEKGARERKVLNRIEYVKRFAPLASPKMLVRLLERNLHVEPRRSRCDRFAQFKVKVGVVRGIEMARAPHREIEQHIDHLPLVHAATPRVRVQFDNVVTAGYSGLEIARLCA